MMTQTLKCHVKLWEVCSFGWKVFLPKREHLHNYSETSKDNNDSTIVHYTIL